MVNRVECVYRVHEKALAVKWEYDLVKGCIYQCEDIMQLDIASMYNYYWENYNDGSYLKTEKLFNALYKFPDALVAVNWNNVGVILIYRDMVRLYIVATGELKPHISVDKPIFKHEFKLLGVAKSTVKTFEVIQPLEYMGYLQKENGDKYIYTEQGRRVYQARQRDVVIGKFDPEMYIQMCSDKDAVGLVTYTNGESVILRHHKNYIM